MSPQSDPFHLQRFVEAQDGAFDSALAELRSGAKRTHWMWFVFPQVAGLGQSPTSRRFAVQSIEEARAYLAHPLLGPRLRQSVEAVLQWAGKRGAAEILGSVDAIKLRSSLTLFAAAAPGEHRFKQALDAFFGSPDLATLRLLG